MGAVDADCRGGGINDAVVGPDCTAAVATIIAAADTAV
jgi:hypothetical protein